LSEWLSVGQLAVPTPLDAHFSPDRPIRAVLAGTRAADGFAGAIGVIALGSTALALAGEKGAELRTRRWLAGGTSAAEFGCHV
jgi:hypothetical protein